MGNFRVALLALLIAAGCGGEPQAAGQAPATTQSRVDAEPDPTLAEEVKTPEPGVLHHVGRRFTLRYPPSWRAVRAIKDGNVLYYLTPGNEIRTERMTVGLKVALATIPRTSEVRGKDAISLFHHYLPAMRGQSPEMLPVGDVKESTLGTLPAATLAFRGPLEDREGQFRLVFHLAPHGNEQYYTSAFAPESEFDKYEETFRKIVADSRFGRVSPPRQARSLEARHIVENHKAATVSVVVVESGRDRSSGTGFLISKSGYLLTNWHVIFDRKRKKPWSQFRVEWDPTLHRKPRPAKLIGYRAQARFAKHTHGTDIALLKIEPGDYPALPLTPLRDVQPGDGVVTLGFPSRGLLQGLAITITRGVVTRFNRDPTGNVRSIFTDAAITHGSSGGPCVSLVTGGVIGLNTFGQPIQRDTLAGGPDLNDLVNYFGVVPIDACMKEFPLVCDLGLAHDTRDLGFMECFELAHLFQGRGSHREASDLADRAVQLKPDSADALWLQAKAMQHMAYVRGEEQGKRVDQSLYDASFAAFEAILKVDPAHARTLTTLAGLCMYQLKYADAVRYADRAIRVDPKQWTFHDTRARIATRQKLYAEAIRHTDKAKEVCGNAYAGPSITAGFAHYANKAYDAGRAEYANAVKLHPQNVSARIGIGRFHEYQNQTNQALAEYEKILVEFPDNAQVLVRMGKTSAAAKRHSDAANYLLRAVKAYEGGGERPPDTAFGSLVRALEALKQYRAGLVICSKWLSHVGSAPAADHPHLRAKDLCYKAKIPGLAHAHLRMARAVTNDAKLKATIAKLRLKPLTLSDVSNMVKLRYRSDVAVPLILKSPLAFTVRTASDVAALRKLGIPAPWILAIGIAQPRATPKRAAPTRPPKAAPRVHGIVGTWRGSTRLNGELVTVIFKFLANGRFTVDGYKRSRKVLADRGTYRVSGLVLRMKGREGKEFRRMFSLRGDRLVLETQGLGSVVLARQR